MTGQLQRGSVYLQFSRPVLFHEEHASVRDFFRRLHGGEQFFQKYEPPPGADPCEGELRLYIGPGQGVNGQTRRHVRTQQSRLLNPRMFPRRMEIEFSCTPKVAYPGAEGSPEDYRRSAIIWALDTCSAVLLCVESGSDRPLGQAYKEFAPLQLVFRTPPEFEDAWRALLMRLMKRRHRFDVVRSAAGAL